jgi:hypothetical protein
MFGRPAIRILAMADRGELEQVLLVCPEGRVSGSGAEK